MAKRGRFIVFEGIEGSGKSTQASALAVLLGAELTREPGGTALGEAIRSLLLHSDSDVDARAELLLMVAARAQHVAEKIAPALDRGVDVVCDRFSGSTIAYQGYGRGLPIEDVEVACELAAGGTTPDLVVLLDLPVEAGRARLVGRPDRIESEARAFHERVADGYRKLALADRRRWIVIDASESQDVVAHNICTEVLVRLRSIDG